MRKLAKYTLEGVDTTDLPDFVDAYISYAEWDDGTPLTEIELETLNKQTEFVHNCVMEHLF